MATPVFLGGHNMSAVVYLDSSELLRGSKLELAALSTERQLEEIFSSASHELGVYGLSLSNVFFVIADVDDMKERPIVNEAQKAIWAPKLYPARIILQRKGHKAGARVRLILSATKHPHVCVNSNEGQIPTGPFSRAAIVGGRVYGSGVRPIDPATQTLVSNDLYEQAMQCLQNLDTNMKSCGTSLQRAYSFTTYLTDLGNVDTVLKAFGQFGLCPSDFAMSFELVQALNEAHPIEIACNATLQYDTGMLCTT